MIWFNLKELERGLITGEVSDKAGFQYLLTFMIILSISAYLPESSSYSDEWWDLGEFLVGLLIMILGMRTTFRINNEGGNKEFLKRFLSLSFVFALRLAIIFLLLHLLFKIIMYVIPLDLYLLIDGIVSEDIFHFVVSLSYSILYYFLLIRSFKRVNRQHYAEATGQIA